MGPKAYLVLNLVTEGNPKRGGRLVVGRLEESDASLIF